MRTSLIEIQKIDQFVTNALPPDDGLVFEAKMIVDPVLRQNTLLHRKLLRLIEYLHRKKMKKQMTELSQDLFADPAKRSFRNQINSIFNSEL